MKKIITTSAVVAVLLTSVQANFYFGDVFKDLNNAKMTMGKNTNESTIKVSDFNFGDVFRDMKEAKESTVKVSHADFNFGDVFSDLNVAKMTMGKNAKESTIKVSVADFYFGDVFRDLKDGAQ